jgi:hypothetical protein
MKVQHEHWRMTNIARWSALLLLALGVTFTGLFVAARLLLDLPHEYDVEESHATRRSFSVAPVIHSGVDAPAIQGNGSSAPHNAGPAPQRFILRSTLATEERP